MNNSSVVILKKTIKDFQSKKSSLEKEILEIDNNIAGIENLLGEAYIEKVEKKTTSKKKRRKKHTIPSRALITENSVRDAIISLISDPPESYSGISKLDIGFFTSGQVAKRIGVSPSATIGKYLNKFADKGMLEARPYKSGKQFRYITPVDNGITNHPAQTSPVVRSESIPGISNNKIHIRDKDVEKLVNKARAQGCMVDRLGSDHILVRNDRGKITLSSTGNKPYEVTKVRADLQKIGVKI